MGQWNQLFKKSKTHLFRPQIIRITKSNLRTISMIILTLWNYCQPTIIFFFRLSHHVFKVFPWKNPGQGNLKSIYRLGFVHREMQQANCFFISHLQPREMKIDFLANTFNVKSPFVEKINDLITWWRTCHEKKSEKREIHIYNVLIIANNKRVFACVCVFAWLYHATMCNKLHSNRKTID